MSQSLPHVLAEGRWLRLVARDGWEYAERTRGLDAVAIIAVTPDDELILTEQFRIPLGRPVLDLPAGLVGDEGRESHESAAARELEEETGFRAERFEDCFRGPTSAGLSNEMVTLVRAQGVSRVAPGGGVRGEQIAVRLVPLQDFWSWLREVQTEGTRLVAPNVLAAAAFLRAERPR